MRFFTVSFQCSELGELKKRKHRIWTRVFPKSHDCSREVLNILLRLFLGAFASTDMGDYYYFSLHSRKYTLFWPVRVIFPPFSVLMQ